jgi:hypothetical protein
MVAGKKKEKKKQEEEVEEETSTSSTVPLPAVSNVTSVQFRVSPGLLTFRIGL